VATDEGELERASGAAADTPLFTSRSQQVIICFREKVAAPKMAHGPGRYPLRGVTAKVCVGDRRDRYPQSRFPARTGCEPLANLESKG
jgi:hypothetical protein